MELTAPQPDEKPCKQCQEVFPLGHYGRDRSKDDGKAIYCRRCNRDKNAQTRISVAAKKQAAIEKSQLRLPITIDDADIKPLVKDVDEIVMEVVAVLRKENYLARPQIRKRIGRKDSEVADALAVLWDRDEAKPSRNGAGEPIWSLLKVA